MQKVIILSNRYLDFVGDDNKPVKGRSIKYIELVQKNGENVYISDERSKIWIKPDNTVLENQAKNLLPGEVVELDYSIEGRRAHAVVSGILPTGELAVDFDKIFK